MRVLLDESVPRKLRRELPGHDVSTVIGIGWGGIENGALLRRAAAAFDVLLAVDSNLPHQQNIAALPGSVLVLAAASNDVDELRPLMSQIRELLPRVHPGQVYRVGAS